MRVLGWKWGLVVQIIDVLKGIAAVVFVVNIFGAKISLGNMTMFEDATIVRFIAGTAAVCGHIWTLFAGFRGGKGINTTVGMLLALAPIDGTISVAIFIIAVVFFRLHFAWINRRSYCLSIFNVFFDLIF